MATNALPPFPVLSAGFLFGSTFGSFGSVSFPGPTGVGPIGVSGSPVYSFGGGETKICVPANIVGFLLS